MHSILVPARLTPVEIADVIRSTGHIMQVRDIGSDEVSTTYVYALSDQAGRGISRRLGTLEEVPVMRRGDLRAAIFSAFRKVGRRKEYMSHYDAI